MEKFEVGYVYSVDGGCGQGADELVWIEEWKCIKINNGKATFKLIDFLISDYGCPDRLETTNFKPRTALCRISKSEIGDYEIAYNGSQRLLIKACD